MSPLIDQELEHVDKKHAALTAANQQLNTALNLYHSLMKESFSMMNTPYYGGIPQQIPQTYGIPQYTGMPSQPTNQMYSHSNNVSAQQMPGMSQQMAVPSVNYQMPFQQIPGQMHAMNGMVTGGPPPHYVNSNAGQHQTIPQQTFIPPIPTAAVGVSQIEQYVK